MNPPELLGGFFIILHKRSVIFSKWLILHMSAEKEETKMARKGVMSDQLKVEIAKELGFYDVVQKEGWGGIRSRDAGNMVKHAIEMASRQVEEKK